METLEFIIHPDGRVEEKVTGIVGSTCAAITAVLEEELGILVSRELTAEHFAQVNTSVQVENSLKHW